MEMFTEWSVSDDGRGLVGGVLQVMSEVCHIKMGLHPATIEEERSVVRYRQGICTCTHYRNDCLIPFPTCTVYHKTCELYILVLLKDGV